MIAILRITLAVHSFAASSALTPALSASILLWPSSATWQAPNTVPLASNRSIAMPGQYAARAQGRCGFRIDGARAARSSLQQGDDAFMCTQCDLASLSRRRLLTAGLLAATAA